MNNRNDNNLKYNVGINSSSVAIPKFCINCMQPTELLDTRKIYSLVNNEHVQNIEMPICNVCAQQRREEYNKLHAIQSDFNKDLNMKARKEGAIIAILSLGLGLLISSLSYFLNAGEIAVILLSLIIPILSLIVFGLNIKFDKKSVGASKYCINANIEKSDDFLSITKRSTGFSFAYSNEEYANVFAKVNNSIVNKNNSTQEINSSESSTTVNLFHSLKRPIVFVNCTPKVRQYDILKITLGVYYYAKRKTKQALYR